MMDKVFYTREYKTRNKDGGRVSVTAEIRSLCDQEPRFAVSGQVIPKGCRNVHSCGQIDEIRTCFGPLAIAHKRFHLCGVVSGPMHYRSHAIYWADKARENHSGPDFDLYGTHLRNHLGFHSDMTDPDWTIYDFIFNMDPKERNQALDEWLPVLMRDFHTALTFVFPNYEGPRQWVGFYGCAQKV